MFFDEENTEDVASEATEATEEATAEEAMPTPEAESAE